MKNQPYAVINGVQYFGLHPSALVKAYLNGFQVVGVATEVLATLGRQQLASVAAKVAQGGETATCALIGTTSRYRQLLAAFHPGAA